MTQNIAMLSSAITLAASIGADLNFNLIRHLLRQPYTSAVMMLLRAAETLSSFTLIGCASACMVQSGLSLPIDLAAVAIATVGATVVSAIMSRRGAKLSPAELIAVKTLKEEIRDEVGRELAGLAEAVKCLAAENRMLRESVRELKEASERHADAIDTLASDVKNMVRGYHVMAEVYRHEAYKRELLALQLREIAKAKQELEGRRKISVFESALKETAGILQAMGFEVEVHTEPGMPAMLLKAGGKPVAVAAHRAFALDNKKPRRFVTSHAIRIEVEAAARLKLPLAILIANLKNGRRWAALIPSDKVASFEHMITPDELWLDTAEAEKACEKSLDLLKEGLLHATA